MEQRTKGNKEKKRKSGGGKKKKKKEGEEMAAISGEVRSFRRRKKRFMEKRQ